MNKCNGNNTQDWGFDAILDVECPNCMNLVEFFKNEINRNCNNKILIGIFKMMNSKRFKKHLRLLSGVTFAWILFWIAGLPDYYQQYSTKFMVIFDILIFPPIWSIVYFNAKHARQNRGLSVGFWFSFYITIPLFIYDLIYCGFYLGYGMSFLWKYWYVTVYYIVPWMVFPLTGWWIDKRNKRSTLNA